jgi:hypothetical protein
MMYRDAPLNPRQLIEQHAISCEEAARADDEKAVRLEREAAKLRTAAQEYREVAKAMLKAADSLSDLAPLADMPVKFAA